MADLYLTERALLDIDEIERCSIDRFGRRVAERYLDDLRSALRRLETDPSLFGGREGYAGRLRFHRVREHVLVGDVIGGVPFVLAVWHGAMDFIDRLPRWEPLLVEEAEILVREIEAGRG